MKTMKRIVCLFLAVMALAAILAIPASAVTDEASVARRGPACKCPYCDTGYMSSTPKKIGSDWYYHYVCDTCGKTMDIFYKEG